MVRESQATLGHSSVSCAPCRTNLYSSVPEVSSHDHSPPSLPHPCRRRGVRRAGARRRQDRGRHAGRPGTAVAVLHRQPQGLLRRAEPRRRHQLRPERRRGDATTHRGLDRDRAVGRHQRSDPCHRQGRPGRHRAHHRQCRALCADRQKGLKTIADFKGKTVSIGSTKDMTTIYFERMAAMSGLKRGDYDVVSAGVAAARYAALKAGVVDAALVLPPLNFQAEKAGYVSIAFAPDYVKDLPFTGMAVFKPWAAQHGGLVKRMLAVTDASIAWLADPAHRDEAVNLLVKAGRADPEDSAASYDLLRRSGYFEPTSKVSRAKLQSLINEERRAGNIGPALTVERLIMPGITELVD